MWEFDDAVEVHSVNVDGLVTPDQFLWRGRLWRVCSVKSHWTETAAWWERGIIGPGRSHDPRAHRTYDGPADGCSAPRTATATRPHKNGAAASASPRSLADCLAAFAPGGGIPGPAPAGSASDDLSAERSSGGLAGAVRAGGERADVESDLGMSGLGMSASPVAVGVLDADWGPERAVFRVVAGSGRHGRRELFDLAHDPHSGRWQLERVMER